MPNMIYCCLDCGHMEQTELPLPPEWPKHQRGAPKRICPECGCASYPQDWYESLWKWIRTDAGQTPDLLAHHFYSGCPNSLVCQIHNHYAADCERGQVMPKCFAAVHGRIADIERRLIQTESTSPVRRQKTAEPAK